MVDREKVEKEAEEIVRRFSEVLERYSFEEVEEYYILECKNVLRMDAEPSVDPSFREDVLKIAPKTRDGYIVVEKSKWE
ncbi:MAG TPA: Asp-tRNA(Asn) amidotransferase subunit GatC [Methanothermococcus okinawensis]|uniref:Aspartyl-tRNA(Asn)/glutamyl-tRNA(Gln) amidotransferase subunit C n=1 Tax=Methanofervidicoccus abyssi TaxID=2082189 RepID=A0A401HNY1_9EURY|nr:Asp-tRNA(Asn) amidotransferase subunit GatC [Methanofervidicoccus abyssi]GBF35922.1 aspartyl-tRNA(Asn)/glutamyl-tRNA(Gln) amidotransferase subunit C [Methanofervidicoccus abyssi]HIP16209.1 Asp-tRNA(Asn) amidotransferase subunit GatC [Methanothermococcus okinawensis]HIP34914.1 Asp-tRNA(Asn) amidotransferase subunit GatC [Methanothermococcus okinawensis]